MRYLWLLSGVLMLLCGMYCCASPRAFATPDGRTFELVSPAYKGGYGATHIEAVALNGDSVAFYSPGVFEGAPAGLSENVDSLDYLSRRETTGWSTVPVMPPDELLTYVFDRDISPTLEETMALGKPGTSEEAAYQEGTQEEFILHDTGMPDISAGWELAGKTLKTLNEEQIILVYQGASEDFCHLFFESIPSSRKANSGVLLENAKQLSPSRAYEQQIYELTRGCGGEPVELRLVSVDAKDNPVSPKCPVVLGITDDYSEFTRSAFNAIATDGGSVFFTTCVNEDKVDHQLFVRLGGAKTIEISKPLGDKCGSQISCPEASERPNASFAGASEDGSKVFFTTTAPLVSEDKDSGNDLYMATLGCSAGSECSVAERDVTSLTQVSRDLNGGEAGVQGVVKVSPDGSRIYFVASGDLLDDADRSMLEAEGRPVPKSGADNLYVFDSIDDQTSFIGDLCSGLDASGAFEDSRCPSRDGVDTALWLSNLSSSESQTAGVDGRYLVFSSYAQLTNDDTDAARDIYRFDALKGTLQRVSGGEMGHDDNGNGSQFDASIPQGHHGGYVRFQYELDSRAISEDGSRIIFMTAEPLSPAATNGLVNLYEWHEGPGGGGSVSLVSGGSSGTSVEDAVIAPGGNDVFFVTTQGLVREDTDGQSDIYDARLNGGFPSLPASSQPCSGDACQGPLTNPAPLLVPGSESQTPGENLQVSTPAKAVKKPTGKKPKKKAPEKRKIESKKRKVAKGKSTRKRSPRNEVQNGGRLK
jgi:hypothetical protein